MTVRGMLHAGELEDLVTHGEIDTVLVAFADLQGRLVGKRVTGHYWLDQMGAGIEPLHACNYLLAVDSEMNVLPGYTFANWEQGYGDVAAQPDLTTIRRIPWLEKTALVLCDVQDEHDGGPGRGVAAPDPATASRAGRGRRLLVDVRERARVLLVPRVAR